MKAFKKLLFVIPLFTIFSCGNSYPDERYQLSEEQFNAFKNKDNILLKSNYTLSVDFGLYAQTSLKLDYGKVELHYGTTTKAYELELKEDIYTFRTYSVDGEVYERTKTKEEAYNYFFDTMVYLIDFDYQSMTYNSSTKQYDVDVTTFDAAYGLTSYTIEVFDGLVKNAKGIINGKPFTITFFNYGTTKVNLEVEKVIKNLVYQCEPVNGKDDSYMVSYANKCLELVNANVRSVEYSEGTLTISIEEAPASRKPYYLEMLLSKTVNERIVLTNAHDTAAENFYADIFLEPYYVTLSLLASDSSFDQLLSEIVSDIQNDNTEYGIPNSSGEGEEEESYYRYPLFLWKQFDEELCTFENYLASETEAIANLLAAPKYDLDSLNEEECFYYVEHNGTYIYMDFWYQDFNGDAILTDDEMQKTINAVDYLVKYINLKNEGFKLYQFVY